MVYSPPQGRLAQRESAAFTRQRSLVRAQHRPPGNSCKRRKNGSPRFSGRGLLTATVLQRDGVLGLGVWERLCLELPEFQRALVSAAVMEELVAPHSNLTSEGWLAQRIVRVKICRRVEGWITVFRSGERVVALTLALSVLVVFGELNGT
jgi:hypothetical protein